MRNVLAAAALAGAATSAVAQPAVVYELGGKFDKSFKEIVDGRLKVVDYTVANACPAAR